MKGCRWYGPALVLGKVGRNIIVAHRKSVLRCAPEQLRPATEDKYPSRLQADADAQELLGMQKLLDQGKFPQNQLVDITGQEFPPTPEETNAPFARELASVHGSTSSAVENSGSNAGQAAAQVVQEQQGVAPDAPGELQEHAHTHPSEQSEFGPVRRVRHKSNPLQMVLGRPSSLQQEDVSEMLRELAPRLVNADPSRGQW